MNTDRGYQSDFYDSFLPIRKREYRLKRAEKIKWALMQHMSLDFSEAVCVDVGCSAGVITASLSSVVGKSIGLDYDRSALAAIDADDKARAEFIRSDAMRLPLADNSVDILICAQVYEHVPYDVQLFREIFRVLQGGGYCFFSGPNWLFPIEPHYFLPFLHWLPEKLADWYLYLAKGETHYYERSRTIFGLKKLLSSFDINDITIDVLFEFHLTSSSFLTKGLRYIPSFMWKMLLPVFPNLNWVLKKPIGM